MSRKWIVLSSFSLLLTFFFGGAASQGLNNDDNSDAVMSIIVGFILDSEGQNSAEFEANGQFVSFQVPDLNLNSISECSASSALPLGLTLQVNNNQSGCEIVGTPSQAFSLTSITISATNDSGDESSVDLLVSVNLAQVISGQVTYDRVPINVNVGLDFANTRQEPVRGATVELLDVSANVLQTTVTDSNGLYTFDINSSEPLRVRVKAEAIQVSTTSANYSVEIVDNTNSDALYALTEAQASTISANPVRNLNAGSGWSIAANSYTGVRAAAPFAILDSIFDAMSRVIDVDSNVVLPPLTVNWSVNNSISAPLPGESTAQSRAAGRIGTSFYIQEELSGFDLDAGELFLVGAIDSDTDEFDRHIVIHEWGHYFEDRLSRSDSIGGSHAGGDLLDFRLAFSEGFGNAISAIVTDDPVYADTFTFFNQFFTFTFDIDNNNVENPGWYSESSVQSILFDLYDNDNDGEDRVSLGFSPIYNAMVGAGHAQTDALTSIFSFIETLSDSQSFGVTNAIDDLLEEQDIDSVFITAFGSVFERNFGGLSSIDFDVYESASLTPNNPNLTFADINSRRVCTATDFIGPDGQTNKLLNSAFLQVDIPVAGQHLITVIQDDFRTDYDDTVPIAIIYKNGEFLDGAISVNGTSLVLAVNLTEPGVHIIEIFDDNIESSVGATGTACFDVGVVAP